MLENPEYPNNDSEVEGGQNPHSALDEPPSKGEYESHDPQTAEQTATSANSAQKVAPDYGGDTVMTRPIGPTLPSWVNTNRYHRNIEL